MTPKIVAALVGCALAAAAIRAAAQPATPTRVSAMTDQTTEVGMRQVHYLRAGSGATTIVLLHGWPQSTREWRRVMRLLADRFTVIAPDLPGIGGSTGPARGAAAPVAVFEKAALARDIHAFVATLGARRVVFVGHDIGGMGAYAYARLYPNELAGVAILDVPLPGIARGTPPTSSRPSRPTCDDPPYRRLFMNHDVIVVGGSYAGLSAAMQLARARKRVLVIDAGLPRNRFAHEGHGFFGQDGRPPFDILRDARGQLAAYPTVTFAAGEAVTAHRTDDGFAVVLADGGEERARRLVLATGVRDELPPVPGLQERWGVSVLHCPYCHGYEVADQPLGVLATQPMSVHQAKLIPDWGPTIYFTQGAFEPSEEDMALLAARGLAIERSSVVELLGTAPELEAVRLADGRTVLLAALFVAPRTHTASPLAEQLGCAFDDGPSGPYVRVDDWRQTSVSGVYAAGDAATPMHSATLASASGAMAGVGAHQSLLYVAPVAEAAHA